MQAAYSEGYYVALESGHPFPMEKYPRVYRTLVNEGTLKPPQIITPDPASFEILQAAHTPEYLERLSLGRPTAREEARTGFRWTPAVVRRARLATQGTLLMARAALRDGIACNLAGGSHHAYPDHGEGFCLLNDLAVTIRVLRAEGLIRRAAVIDCDAHQGNGTAGACREDPDVFTFSMHSQHNYPFTKERSTLDVGLDDGTGDLAYLALLETHVPAILRTFQPDLVLYVAGADPYRGDRLGRLGLSLEGLRRRDAFVLGQCRDAGIPVVTTFAGGYGQDVRDTVEIHSNTVRTARRILA